MFNHYSIELLHQLTNLLLQPVIWLLLGLMLLALYELGISLAERFGGIQRLVREQNQQQLEKQGKHRIERADMISRIPPMLGLMGTLIPLGPGLSALGDGEVQILTTAMSIAFDTTVAGLFTGIIGFVLGRFRRRWYDQAIQQLEQLDAA